jgi:hypothetical protein
VEICEIAMQLMEPSFKQLILLQDFFMKWSGLLVTGILYSLRIVVDDNVVSKNYTVLLKKM